VRTSRRPSSFQVIGVCAHQPTHTHHIMGLIAGFVAFQEYETHPNGLFVLMEVTRATESYPNQVSMNADAVQIVLFSKSDESG
jgi:hypothetical protein